MRDRFTLLAAVLLAGLSGIPCAAQPEATNGPADLSGARALVREGQLPEARSALEALRAEHPDDAALLLMLGEVLLAEGKSADAVPVLRRSFEIDEARERVAFQLGTALASAGDIDGALAAFDRELQVSQDPDVLAMARLNRSLLFQRSERWGEAAEELEYALQFRPDRPEIYADLATAYLQAGKVDQAVGALDRGADFGLSSAQHRYSVGAALYRAERYEDAAAQFRAAIAADPDLAEAHRSLGATLDKLAQPADAARELETYLHLRPGAPDTEKVRAEIRRLKGGSKKR